MVPNDENELRDIMQRTTDAHHPDVAFRLFQVWNERPENTATMAATWLEVARAARLSNHREPAVQYYLRKMQSCDDYVTGMEDDFPD